MLAKAGGIFGVVAITALLAGSVGAAAMEPPARPMIDVAPAAQAVPESNEGPGVPVTPLPDPTTTTTAPPRAPRVRATTAAPKAAGGTAVSFTIVDRPR
ncbi:MAG: hypothetical protein JOZ68_05530 [Acidimicrobiia bacterium]|nr:hypothetical protein [Acidimicrobiia bacterium]